MSARVVQLVPYVVPVRGTPPSGESYGIGGGLVVLALAATQSGGGEARS
jgi:hypothetical protein